MEFFSKSYLCGGDILHNTLRVKTFFRSDSQYQYAVVSGSTIPVANSQYRNAVASGRVVQ
jgi:hypothetical protein